MNELYIDLVQIAFYQRNVLELILSVAEINIYNKKHYIESRVVRNLVPRAWEKALGTRLGCTET